ncbi:glycosyltransferase [[Phormidium ambiguum] IAM M-71]|uniref:Glycosyltransferase n=1 Tax=[Phormidium ambiguum] IAM M-71 TaxID=454136 RepID=A0A1U7I3Z2_9CYAN|nr:glycosyltransferase [Phormidium ambiguum]OKH30846.1 glycosyltransferase [Phormidium ambiguum IAM M-71]
MRYFLLFPNMFGFKGGIQVYSEFLLRGLQILSPSAEYDVFLKYDRQSPLNPQFLPQTQFHCFGNLPRILQSFWMAFSVLWLTIRKRPSLMISTHVNYSPICYWLKRLFGVPYWVVVHGLEGWNLSDKGQCLALRYADKVVAVSHYTRSRLLAEQQLDDSQVVVLPNTFEPQRFQIAPKPDYLLERYKLKAEQPIILTVTRLGKSARYKGYEQILQALVLVRRLIPDVHYVLVGKGDDTPRIKELISQLGLSDCVTLTGFVPDQELCDYYNLCDVFALPSQGEGFGIVYLEALACGKPVLAGNLDGAIDPLLGGKLGCLVEPDDVSAIASSLVQLLWKSYPNPLLFHRAKLRSQVVQLFAFEGFCSCLSELLKQEAVNSEFNSVDSFLRVNSLG